MMDFYVFLSICVHFILFFGKNEASVDPALAKFNTKVYAEFYGEQAQLDSLTDDDIKKIEYSDGFLKEEPSFQWPEGVVPYQLESIKFDDRFLTEFYLALDEFHSKTCVRFRPKRAGDKFFVKIIRNDGCWSYVGMQPELENVGQELSLGDECWRKGVIVHELNHVLGFFHEHSRFDRDMYVYLNVDNIQKNRLKQFDKRLRERVDDIGVYDLYSIMHYEQNAFSINKKSPTIIPKIKNARINEMGQRRGLSPLDIQKIRTFYNCSDYSTPHKQINSINDKDLEFPQKFRKQEPSNLALKHGFYEVPFTGSAGDGKNERLMPVGARIGQELVPFRDLEDFRIRTGRTTVPEGIVFEKLNSSRSGLGSVENQQKGAHRMDRSFKMYPESEYSNPRIAIEPRNEAVQNSVKCPYPAAGNCMDRLDDCFQLASDGYCEKQPGKMLIMCKRSCCNCDNSKCHDTLDRQKYDTLCLAKTQNSVITSCLNPSTRENALIYCPKLCSVCFDSVKN